MNVKVLHITNWYPNAWSPHETPFIKAHFEACKQYVEQELWHIQVRNEGSFFKIHIGDYSKNEHYIILETHIQVWKLQEIFTLLLLSMLRIKLGKKWWNVVNVHIAYPLLRFTKVFQYMFGKAVVLTEHWSAYRNNFFLPPKSKAAKRIANTFNYGLPVVAVSRALMDDIVSFVGHDNFSKHIIPNVVDPAIFFPKFETSSIFPIFLMVASWAKIKRPFLAIEAFVEFLKECPEAKLRIVGTGFQFKEMQEFVKKKRLENNIELLGAMNKEAIGREMRQADCFLHASDYETFSVVCAEALSSGLPVIASDVGGIPEFVNRNNGILVENTHESWVAALKKYVKLKDGLDRKKLAEINRKDFSPDVLGKKFERLYELIIAGENR